MSLLLRNLTKQFASAAGDVHSAVSDLTLEVEQGRFYTLLGPSGCGKTTLLRLIAGFEHPTRGDISYRGRRIDHVPPYQRGFPMVFQSYALFPHMTVQRNVEYGLRVRHTSAAAQAAQVARALELLGLQDLRDRHPHELSGGQQQRVALARALVLEPEIILLDEPLSNLDAELRVSMRAEIRALQRRLGITALYVTHDQEEALAISDHIVVMNAGRVEQAGSPADIFERPRTEFVARFMGFSNIFPLERTAPDQILLLGAAYTCTPPAGAHQVLVRPDTVRVSAQTGRHRATIEDVTYLGFRTRYLLEIGDGARITIDDQLRFHPGDVVYFDIVVQQLRFL